MSLKSLPLLFINLGGEMIYILQQRLTAQSIDAGKAHKVLNEIVSTMFNGKFMEELFKPQETYTKKAVRTVFDRLAHSSIMRLNSASMDKLYDLMTMAVKYQISLIEHPRDIILVTLNHIDGIRSLVGGQPKVQQHVDGVYLRFMQAYGSLKDGEFQLLRQTLLSFFQDSHVRVSIFLKEKQQLPDGQFVLPTKGPLPHGTEVPGTIRYFDKSGGGGQQQQLTHETTFDCSGCGPYTAGGKRGSCDIVGDRVTTLGTNLYSSTAAASRPTDVSASGGEPSPGDGGDAAATAAHDQLAKAQLDLLCHLIGGGSSGGGRPSGSFRLNLFSSADESGVDRTSPRAPASQPGSTAAEGNVVTIDATCRTRSEQLVKIMGDLSVGSTSGKNGNGCDDDDDDLLELMDRA